MQCKYEWAPERRCSREAISDRGLCLLHEEWKYKSEEATKEAFLKEIKERKEDFCGAILPEIDLTGEVIECELNLNWAMIKGSVLCNEVTMEGGASFRGATIEGHVEFEKAKMKDVSFEGAKIKGAAWFTDAIIEENVIFHGAEMGGAWFEGVVVKGNARFNFVKIDRGTMFNRATIEGDATFNWATIGEEVNFNQANIHSLTFEHARFHYEWAQENACRASKVTQDRIGNRELADYHFYREMEAKRRCKRRLIGWLESPIQYVFGYGVRPFWVIRSWLLVVLAFALIYWLGHGINEAGSFWENLYFSVVTAATPGYGGFEPNPGFIVLATFQAIFGTFMWAAIIATFARKFMR